MSVQFADIATHSVVLGSGGVLDEGFRPTLVGNDTADEPFEKSLVRKFGSPLLVLDCDRVQTQYRQLSDALPGVDLHYSVRALSHPAALSALAAEGAFFDAWTTGEIDHLRNLGIASDRVIYTHPIKRDRDIQDALAFGCETFVIDNVYELQKFVAHRDRTSLSLVLRIGFRDADSDAGSSKRFGCDPAEVPDLLTIAYKMGLRIEGLSFRVGSAAGSSAANVQAIQECAKFVERAGSLGVTPIRRIGIGSGFPSSDRAQSPDIEDFCVPIRNALAELPPQIRVYSEVGRYVAAPAVLGIATVVGKARRGTAIWYYLDDGVYGSHSGKVFGDASYPLTAIAAAPGKIQSSVLAGPTCDSIDVVAEGILLPELQIGDLLVARSLGAYSIASASEFNSIPKTKMVVVNSAGRVGE